MNATSKNLYEKVLLDHAKNPRNFKAMEEYDKKVHGVNPLCGDSFTFYLKVDEEKVREVSFVGQGCAISKASASLLTSLVENKPIAEVIEIIHRFLKKMQEPHTDEVDEKEWGKLVILAGVREFPIRIKCATLPWHTLLNALQNDQQESSHKQS